MSLAKPPAIGSVEWFKYINDNVQPFKPNPQPHKECKEVHTIPFLFNNTATSTASVALNIPFDVKRVKYSIVANTFAGYSRDIHLLLCSLTGDYIGCVSQAQADLTEIQTHEFIYTQPRQFRNELLTMQNYSIRTRAVDPISASVALILELSNY
jgi:hypothetical protein